MSNRAIGKILLTSDLGNKVLPDNIKDPDQLLKEFGKEALEKVIADAEVVQGISTITDLRYAESLKTIKSEAAARDIGIIKDNRLNVPENIGEMIKEYRTLHKGIKEYEELNKAIEVAEKENVTLKVGIAYKQQENIERSGALDQFRELKEKIIPSIKYLPNELRNAYYHPDKNIDEEEFKAQVADIKQAHESAYNKVDNDIEKFEILDVQIKYCKEIASNKQAKQDELKKVSITCDGIGSEIETIIKEVGQGIKESLNDTKLAERQLEGKVYDALLETLSREGVKLKGTTVLGIKNKARIKAEEALNKTIANLNEAIKQKELQHKQLSDKDLLSRQIHGLQVIQNKFNLSEKQELYTNLHNYLGERFNSLNEEQKTRYILAGGGKGIENDHFTKHRMYMSQSGKDLVDKITSNKVLKYNDWIKEANVDKLVTQNVQRTNELDNPVIEHIKANNRGLHIK